MKHTRATKALKDYLKTQYSQAIQEVQEAADKQEEHILAGYEQEGVNQATALLQARKRAARAEQTRTIAQAKLSAREEVDQALSELAEQTITYLRAHQPPANKQVAAYEKRIREAIAKRGLDEEVFRFQSDKKTRAVTASSDELLLEESLDKELHIRKQRIKQAIKQQLT